MSTRQIQENLKNLSGDELAQVQTAILLGAESNPEEAVLAMGLISQEVMTRQSEGIGRKAGRLWKRHGETVGAVAIGALLGVSIGD